jgi:hypothetical protein
MKLKAAAFAIAFALGSSALFAAPFEIVKAEYGAGDKWNDVSAAVKSELSGDALKIEASNEKFGDPAEGSEKLLKVTVKYNGKTIVMKAVERTTLLIDKAALDKAASLASLQVVKAEYGAGSSWKDVTEIAKPQLEANGKVEVSNNLFGDPAPGQGKTLKVTVSFEGKSVVVNGAEKTTLVLDEKLLKASQGVQKVEVLKAVYGVEGNWKDVTEKVQSLLSNGSSTVEATNDNFGDPVEGEQKTLKIKYKFEGKELEKSAEENAAIQLF